MIIIISDYLVDMNLFLILTLFLTLLRPVAPNVNGIREIPTFGQEPIILGGVFAGHHEQFIPGLTIFKVP